MGKNVREKTIEKQLVSRVEKLGGWAIKLWPISVSGLPDRLVLMPGGRAWFVELKRPNTTVIAGGLQAWIHARLVCLGFPVWVVKDENTLKDFINEVYPL